jgi:hypothetical protein
MSIGEDGGTGKEGKNGRIVRGDTRWRQVAAFFGGKVLEIARKAFSVVLVRFCSTNLAGRRLLRFRF